jgi:hypothetical protein
MLRLRLRSYYRRKEKTSKSEKKKEVLFHGTKVSVYGGAVSPQKDKK